VTIRQTAQRPLRDAGRTSSRGRTFAMVAVIGLSLTACAGGGQLALTTGSIMPLGDSPSVPGTPVSVYERLGRAALGCWFGPKGPLTRSHQYTAEISPPSKPGPAEIVIFEKDGAAGNQRSIRAYRIGLTPEGEEATRVTIQNLKLPADLADAMAKDVVAWAGDKSQCEAQVVRPPPPEPEPAPAKSKKTVKKKSQP
jgi:hypothetical protein